MKKYNGEDLERSLRMQWQPAVELTRTASSRIERNVALDCRARTTQHVAEFVYTQFVFLYTRRGSCAVRNRNRS